MPTHEEDPPTARHGAIVRTPLQLWKAAGGVIGVPVTDDVQQRYVELLIGEGHLVPTATNDWAAALITAATWAHLSHSPVCLGAVIEQGGRALCGRCGWRISARLEEVGTARSSRFAIFALASIGANFTWKLVDAMRDR